MQVEYGKKNSLYIKTGCLTLLLIISYFSIIPTNAQLTPSEDTIVVALGTEPGAFDPQYSFGMNNLGLMRLVTETLVKIDQITGEILPVLATSWTTDRNAKNWIIKLRQGVKFHDGSDFDAYSVKYTLWDKVADPNSGAYVQRTFGPPGGPITGISVVDKYTIEIQTNGFAHLMPYFNYQPSEIVSKTKCDSFDSTDDIRVCEDFQFDPSGTGPYKFVKWVKGDYIQYERNEDYWGTKPAFKNFIWKKIPESSNKLTALLAGEVDYIHNIHPADANIVLTNPDVYIIEAAPNRMMHIGLSPCNTPLTDRRVRQALNYAVDQAKIVDTTYAGYGAAMIDTFLAPNAYGIQSGNISYNQNVAMAKLLLDSAGYTVDATTGNRFEFKLIYGAGRYTADKQIVEAVQSFLADVDVKMNIEALEWATYSALSKLRTCTEISPYFDAWFVGFGNPWMNSDGALRNFVSTGQALEPLLYDNSRYDELFIKSIVETDETTLFSLYEEMTDIVMNDAPWIFLTFQPSIHAARRVLDITTYHDETVDIFGAYIPGTPTTPTTTTTASTTTTPNVQELFDPVGDASVDFGDITNVGISYSASSGMLTFSVITNAEIPTSSFATDEGVEGTADDLYLIFTIILNPDELYSLWIAWESSPWIASLTPSNSWHTENQLWTGTVIKNGNKLSVSFPASKLKDGKTFSWYCSLEYSHWEDYSQIYDSTDFCPDSWYSSPATFSIETATSAPTTTTTPVPPTIPTTPGFSIFIGIIGLFVLVLFSRKRKRNPQ